MRIVRRGKAIDVRCPYCGNTYGGDLIVLSGDGDDWGDFNLVICQEPCDREFYITKDGKILTFSQAVDAGLMKDVKADLREAGERRKKMLAEEERTGVRHAWKLVNGELKLVTYEEWLHG